MVDGQSGKSLCLKIEKRIVLEVHANRNPTLHNGFVDDSNLAEGIVDGEVLVFC